MRVTTRYAACWLLMLLHIAVIGHCSSSSSSPPSPAVYHDYIIVGAGPAGLQLGYFFERARRDYLILERAERAGTWLLPFPISLIHKKLHFVELLWI